MTRRRRVLLSGGAAAAMLTGLLPAYGPVGASAAGCAHVRTHNGWSTIDEPTFPSGAGGVVVGTRQFAEANGVFFLTDGRTLMRSLTGGCSWEQVFTLQSSSPGTSVTDDAAMADPVNTIQSLVVVPSAKGRSANTIYLAIADGLSTFTFVAGTPVYVYVSHDDGATWGHAQVPLAMPTADNSSGLGVGSSAQVQAVASAASPNHVYVATAPVVFGAYAEPDLAHEAEPSVPSMAAPLFGLFSSPDSGATWAHPAPNGLPHGNAAYYSAMIANPTVAGTVYVTMTAPGSSLGSAFSVYRSTDFGHTWKHLVDIPGATWLVRARVSAAGHTILASTGSTAYLSVDGGRKWSAIPEPMVVGGGWSLHYADAFIAGPGRTLIDVLQYNSNMTGHQQVTMWQAYDPKRRLWHPVRSPLVDSGVPKSKPQQPDSYAYGSWADAPGGAVIDLLVSAHTVQYLLRHTGPMK